MAMIFHYRTEHGKISELHFTFVTFLFGTSSRRMLLIYPIFPLRLAFFKVKWDKSAVKTFNLSHFPPRLAFFKVKWDKFAVKTFNLSHFSSAACFLPS